MSTFRVSIGSNSTSDLQNRIDTGLDFHIQQSGGNYTEGEIERVSTLSRKLFVTSSDISAELLEPIRAAAALSNCELKPNPDFSSHRPVIGKIIVFVKKLTWPLIRFHLHRQFDAMGEYNRWILYSQVKLFEESNRTRAR